MLSSVENRCWPTCAYIDLNPVAAGIALVPEASPHTSLNQRVESIDAKARIADLKAAERGSVSGSGTSASLEDPHWLCPIENRRQLGSRRGTWTSPGAVMTILNELCFTQKAIRRHRAVDFDDANSAGPKVGTIVRLHAFIV